MANSTPPTEAVLIKAALKRRRITARHAAQQAGVSEARWYQIMRGNQTVGGTRVPVVAPPDTLARMAQAVGITADQLEEAGRPDAAEELRTLAVEAAAPAFSSEESWILRDERARAIMALDLPWEERVQGVKDLLEAELQRLREREQERRSASNAS